MNISNNLSLLNYILNEHEINKLEKVIYTFKCIKFPGNFILKIHICVNILNNSECLKH